MSKAKALQKVRERNESALADPVGTAEALIDLPWLAEALTAWPNPWERLRLDRVAPVLESGQLSPRFVEAAYAEMLEAYPPVVWRAARVRTLLAQERSGMLAYLERGLVRSEVLAELLRYLAELPEAPGSTRGRAQSAGAGLVTLRPRAIREALRRSGVEWGRLQEASPAVRRSTEEELERALEMLRQVGQVGNRGPMRVPD